MEWSVPHVLSFEDQLKPLVNNDYQIALENAWWDQLMTERPSTGRKEDWEFLLTTADIHFLPEGQMVYDELVSSYLTFENKDFGTGLKVSRNQWSDDQLGKATEWAAQVGASMALAPQYQLIALLLAGETGLAYDGKAFFATDHPVNPFDTGKGTYSNLITTPLPLVDVNGNVIPQNYNAGRALMRAFKMPNGRNRNLAPSAIIVPPSLELAANILTSSRMINLTDNPLAQGGTFNGTITSGVKVIVINELESEPNTWYLVANNGGQNLLPFIYSLREPYYMNSYTGMTQAALSERNELWWHVRGRNVAFYGNPYQIIKFDND